MSDSLCFQRGDATIARLCLRTSGPGMIEDWSHLRQAMIRSRPPEFTRDEWAYLISFLDPENLWAPFLTSFGARIETTASPDRILTPRSRLAVWLPNNVSLLGPLCLVLLSLSTSPVRMKSGSTGADLAAPWLAFAARHVRPGGLRDYLVSDVVVGQFGRADARNSEMAGEAHVRIVFGSDESAAAIHALPHPVDSIGFSFTDRQSRAWVEADACTPAALENLARVIAVYGRSACTAPRRILVLDSTAGGALRVRDALCQAWNRTQTDDVAMHVASQNILGFQLSRANGWDSVLTRSNGAVFACGSGALADPEQDFAVPVQPATLEEAIEELPRNIQTVGHLVSDPSKYLPRIAETRIKRFVPVARMHHFGPVWDGHAFWRELFEEKEVS